MEGAKNKAFPCHSAVSHHTSTLHSKHVADKPQV